MRTFLIIISFINTLLYVLIYSYYDNALELLGISLVSAGFQNFFKTLVLLIVGFCIGIISVLLLNLRGEKSYFDLKNFFLLGTIPFFLFLFSQLPILNFITANLLGNNTQLQELVFYLLSRQAVWALWLGFSLGTSVKIQFKDAGHKHVVKYSTKGNSQADLGE